MTPDWLSSPVSCIIHICSLCPAWTHYSQLLEGTCDCLFLCLCWYCLPFLNIVLSPLAHLVNSYSFFSTQLVIFSTKPPCPPSCFQIGLNTWPFVYYGTGSHLERTNVRSYIESAWRIGVAIGTQ